MKNYKQFVKENIETAPRYKSDEDIEAGYSEFEVEEFKLEARDMSYMYPDGTFEAMVVWKFNPDSEDEDELTEGGYNTSVEDVIYTTIPVDGTCLYEYVINNWYPESVYNRMCDIIENKLKEKYGYEYEKGYIPSKKYSITEKKMKIMKKFTKFVEAYEMNMENYDDLAREHAKVVISDYIDGELEGESLQSAFAKMVADNGLEEDMEGPQYITKQALIQLAQEILDQANNIQLIKESK